MKVWIPSQIDSTDRLVVLNSPTTKCSSDFELKQPDVGQLAGQIRFALNKYKVLPEFANAMNQSTLTGLVKQLGWTVAQSVGDNTPVTKVHGICTEPVNLQEPLKDERAWGGGLSYAEFKRLKEEGVIVLQPRLAASLLIEDVPIFHGTRRLSNFPDIRIGYNNGIGRETAFCGGNVYESPPGFHNQYVRIPLAHHKTGVQFLYAKSGAPGGWLEATHQTSVFRDYGRPDPDLLYGYLMQLDPPTALRNEALDEAYAGVYDILTELGELPETISYVYNTLRRIIQAFIGMKSKEAVARKKFKGKELVDEIASLWMQYRYAVGPLAYSVHDILAYSEQKHGTYITVRKRKDSPFRVDIGPYSFTGVAEHRCFVKCRVKPDAKYYGLGMNPLKTLWELTPLSFVYDWVLPIGSMLGGLMPPSHVTQTAVSESIRIRQCNVECGGHVMPCELNFYRSRVVPAKTTIPLPDVSMTWKRGLDALALSWSMFLKQTLSSRK